jgi:PTS system galactitol-specific IIA component
LEEDTQKIAFDATFVRHFSKAVTYSEMIDQLSQNLLDKQLVTKDYPQAVKDREKKFPTGLPTEPMGVAIPHTDPKYVRVNAVSVGILKEPIEMTVMGTENEKVNVSIIFLLSLGQSNKQLNILSRIMSVVQNQEMLKRFENASNEEVADTVKKAILEGLS